MTDLFIKPVTEVFSDGDIIASYFFGSQATGQARKDSDYDIAIFVEDKHKINATKLIKQVIDSFKYPEKLQVTVIDLYNSSPLLLFEIIKNGQLIHEKETNNHIEIESMIMRLYFDDQHRQSIFYKYLEKKYAH